MSPPPLPALWLCADLGHPAAGELPERIARCLALGPALVWLRPAPSASARALLALGEALRDALHAAGGALLVGERLDVALALGADGVHLPARGLPPADARALATRMGREDFVISVAVHDEDDLDRARAHATALVLAPFGAVPGKGPALGPARFAALGARAEGAFLVALGGITTADDVRAARAAGARAVAVRRALLESDDPACASLRAALDPDPPR